MSAIWNYGDSTVIAIRKRNTLANAARFPSGPSTSSGCIDWYSRLNVLNRWPITFFASFFRRLSIAPSQRRERSYAVWGRHFADHEKRGCRLNVPLQRRHGMGRSFWSVMTIMLVLFMATTYPSRGEEGWGAGARGKLGMELAVITESSASECSARLQAFVEELEGLFPRLTSVAPIQLLLKKYFPIS